MSSAPQVREAYFSLGSSARLLSRPPGSIQLSRNLYLQAFPRQKGIGSLPSATNTICWGPRRGLTARSALFENPQYMPAKAKTISISSTLFFMGELSWRRVRAGRSICLCQDRMGAKTLWITLVSWNSSREVATPRCGGQRLFCSRMCSVRELVMEDLRGDGRPHRGCIGE